jgi:hypothetical protein
MKISGKKANWRASPGRVVTMAITTRTRIVPAEGPPPVRGKLNYLCRDQQPRVAERSKPCWLLEAAPIQGKFIGHDGKVTAFVTVGDVPVAEAANDPG